MLYIRHFYRRPQRAAMFSLLILLLGMMLLGNFHDWTAGLRASSAAPAPPPPPPCAPIPAGMVSWWPGNGNTNDIEPTGTPNNGAWSGTLMYATGMVGPAFKFDGTNFVTVPDPASADLDVGLGNFSIDAWVQINPADAAGVRAIQDKRDPALGYTGYALFLFNGKLGVQLSSGVPTNFISDNPNIADGSLHHVAVSINRSSATGGQLFVDGNPVTVSGNLTFNPMGFGSLSNASPFLIGGHADMPALRFKGLIDELEFFNTAITPTNVLNIYQALSTGKCRNCLAPPAQMVGWWPGDGNANDLTGGSNGMLQNGATATATGIVGQAFNLNGPTDYVQVPSTAALQPATAITVDFWFNSSNPGAEAYLLSKGQEGCSFASYSFNRVGGTGGLFFDVHTSGNLLARSPESSNAIFDGSWHHIAGTYDSVTQRVRLFVDGVPQGPGGGIGNPASGNLLYGLSTNDLLIFGRFDPGNICAPANRYNYNGLIDEVEIFSRALTDAEIKAISQADNLGKCKPGPPGPTTADLTIAKTDNVTTVTPGSTVTYMITVMNNGPDNVTGALVNDTFPSTITNVSWTCTPSSGANCPSGPQSGDISSVPVNLNSGSSVVFTVTGTVSNTAVPGNTIVNTATVTAPPGVTDPNGNNSSTDTDTIVSSPTAVDLVLTPTSCAALMRGKTGSMQLRVANNGPSTATGVMSTTTLPSSVDLCSTSSTFGVTCVSSINFLGQTIVKCDFSTIAASGFKTVRINFRPRCSAASPIVTSNTVWANEFELVPRNNSLGTSSNVTGTCTIPSPCIVPPAGICLP